MHCISCGRKVPDAAAVCPHCQPSPPPPPRRSGNRAYFGLTWQWSIRRFVKTVLILLLPTLPRVADALHLHLPLRTSTLVREAVSRAIEDSRIVDQIGRPVRTHWNIGGYIRTNESGWSEGRLWIPISGPRADATLYARAGRGSGSWVFTTLEFRPSRGDRIDLLGRDAPSATGLVARGRVYLVHLGTPTTIDLEPFREYYRQTFGLDVSILPPVGLDTDVVDARRQQLVAERVIASMQRSVAAVADDPDSIVIGVVERDMYIAGLNRNHAFNFRSDERFAVVSTARMTPRFQWLWPRNDLLASRLRKTLTKNVGVLAYRLPLSDDPTSVLYRGITGVADLDAVQDRFEGLGRRAVVSPTVVTHRADPIKAEFRTRPSTGPSDASYPCFLVSPVTDWDGRAPIDAHVDRCTPGLRTDRRFDELEVDLRRGIVVVRHTDFYRPDSQPLVLTRGYHSWDDISRAFGIGGNHPYDILPVGSRSPYTFIEIVMPDGGLIHYDRISEGTDYADAVYEHQGRTAFLGSRFSWNGNGWDLRFPDGALFVFPENYSGVRSNQGAPFGMQDAAGHRIVFQRDRDRNLTRLTSPSGHFLSFEYDNAYRVRQVTDDDGRVVRYEYDAGGRLAAMTDSTRHMRYSYDGTLLSRIASQEDGTLIDLSYRKRSVTEIAFANGRRFDFSPVFSDGDSRRPTGVAIVDESGRTTSVDLAAPQ